MLYAIGDIHGCAREFSLLLGKIQPKSSDTVVLLGDYIDRGPDSRGVIDAILELSAKTNVVALKGNHEQLFLDFLESPDSPGAGVFILNGGAATLASYPGPGGSFEIPESHIQFLYGLKTSYQTATHFFVHAGVPIKPLEDITEEDTEKLLWSRQPFLSSDYRWSKIIVHGHTPVNAPERLANRINLDTGCVYNGHLTAIELPTGKLIQVAREVSAAKSRTLLQPSTASTTSTGEHRVAVRFTGRLPVFVLGEGSTSRVFETLNYNQFGVLMREVNNENGAAHLVKGQQIEGFIGPSGPSAIKFSGTVMRVDSRNNVRLYGVSLDRVTNGNDGREWIERPA